MFIQLLFIQDTIVTKSLTNLFSANGHFIECSFPYLFIPMHARDFQIIYDIYGVINDLPNSKKLSFLLILILYFIRNELVFIYFTF